MDRLLQVRSDIQPIFEDKYLNVESQVFEVPHRWSTMSLRQQYLMLLNKTNILELCIDIFRNAFPEINLVDCSETDKLLKNVVTDMQPWITNETTSENVIIRSKYTELFLCSNVKVIPCVDYIAFQVFGCPYSRDIDIAVLVQSHLELTENINKDRLYKELEELGYDVTRGVDINVMYCDNGVVMGSTKGSNETQNMLYLTYDLHRQKYPLFVSGLVHVNEVDKISATAKFILDNLRIFIGDTKYATERLNKIAAYAGKWNRVTYVISILDKIKISDTNVSKECFKSLTMKIIQLILLERNEFEYEKYGLARRFNGIFPGHYDMIVWLLMRGTDGIYNSDTIQLLLGQFQRIAMNININDHVWTTLPVDLTHNPTHLPQSAFDEFVRSPLIPTPKFIEEFENICPDRNVNCFLIKPNNGDLLPLDVRDRAICIPQRSPEWLELLTFYSCGRNTGVKKYDGDDWVHYYFNLIRGCIVELIVINSCDFSTLFPGCRKISVGFLVEKIGKIGCLGIAPDLLLLVGNEVIPVEIKCLTGQLSDNHHYRRDILLATRQLESSVKLVGCNRGVIVLVYVTDNGFNTYATTVAF